MTEGVNRLEAEHILYRGYCFIPTEGVEPERVARQLQRAMAGRTPPGETRWSVTGGLGPGDTVLQVKGANYHECRELLDQLRLAVGQDSSGSAVSWQLEAMLQGDAADLPLLGRKFVDNLGGALYSVADYSGSVHILAHVPWVPDQLMLDEGPVNLNLELYADPLSGRVRLRAGIPVLLSLSHYPD